MANNDRQRMTSYDDIPYPSYPRPHSHPRHLEVIASLIGLDPPPISNCRVLEIGCGTCGNLLPIARSLPNATCVGVDLSQVQIDIAQRLIDAAQVANLTISRLDILDIGSEFGQFDYIICHGVYSWVPRQVQRKILEICRDHLTSNGVAFVSYNTYPGWHQRGVIRQMMHYHANRFPDDSPLQKTKRARELLSFLAHTTKASPSSYSKMLEEQRSLLSELPNGYLFHEHLEEVNEPQWFLDFCYQLAPMQLRYLADADFSSMVADSRLPVEARSILDDYTSEFLEREQYLDFLCNRSFRQSIISHSNQQPNYQVKSERLARLFVGTALKRKDSSRSLRDPGDEEFVMSDGLTLTTPLPIFKAALVSASSFWPGHVSIEQLFQLSLAAIQADQSEPIHVQELRDQLLRALLTSYSTATKQLVELSKTPPRLLNEAPIHPMVDRLARAQAVMDLPVVNLRHEVVSLNPFDRFLLKLLDGKTTVDQALAAVRLGISSGELELASNSSDLRIEDPVQMVSDFVQERMRFFARVAMFVSETSE